MRHMNACVLHRTGPVSQNPLRAERVPQPQPGRGEALLKIRACGVCRTDLHVVEGELDQGRQKSPLIPGHQVVGEVIGFGDRSTGARHGGVRIGDRVGVAWLNRTCGECRYCTSGRENLCDRAEFTGWTRDGGYAEFLAAPLEFLYPLPQTMADLAIAPLLCAGIIGYRCLRQCELNDWCGARLGIYGFGAAGHIAIQIARARGARVYVCTRDRAHHQTLAEELGAAWVGDTFEAPPVKLDAAIVFAPAGEIVPAALRALDRAGRLVLGGIHMSPIPAIDYRWLYHERVIRSVANNTRVDGREFLAEAASAGVKTRVRSFPLASANEALIALKHDAISGAAVLVV